MCTPPSVALYSSLHSYRLARIDLPHQQTIVSLEICTPSDICFVDFITNYQRCQKLIPTYYQSLSFLRLTSVSLEFFYWSLHDDNINLHCIANSQNESGDSVSCVV